MATIEATGATFSPDRLYRYVLWRMWDADLASVMFVGLNPSTADENLDDPTIRRCMGFAKAWGYGSLFMLNLFALRSTDPTELRATYLAMGDPMGPDNNRWLRHYGMISAVIVVAWGNHGTLMHRGGIVRGLLGGVYCLGTTKTGQPKHPLYLPKDTVLEEWRCPL